MSYTNPVPTIRVENAVKSFKGQNVLRNVTLHCMPGQICGIVGYNGSGKTVLFKCICGLYSLDEGEIWIRDKRMKKDMDMLTEAGIIIEEPAFLRNYSGYKNLEEGSQLFAGNASTVGYRTSNYGRAADSDSG